MKGHKRSHISLSKLQSPITTQWLHDNYDMEEGMSLPRSSLYTHYLDFCTKNTIVPVNAASFGKIIRSTFPELKTRRLGTRGQSKYHYYGISIKKTSQYYDAVSNNVRLSASGSGQTYTKTNEIEENEPKTATLANSQETSSNHSNRNNHNKSTSDDNNNGSSSNVAANGTLLPEFPNEDSLNLLDDVLKDKVKTFLIMYRAHCQRILDTILRANFAEVQNFLVHFWQGMPAHITVILSNEAVIDLIGNCDNILYKAVARVLIPSSLQPLPASLTQAIQQFAKQLSVWLEMALYHLPEDLQHKKISVAKSFSQLLCRQTSLSHLAQAARTVLHNAEPASQMVTDIHDVPIESIIQQVMWISPQYMKRDMKLAEKFLREFCDLLEQQSSIEDYTDWISSLICRCVVKPSEKEDAVFQSLAQEFLLKWSFVTSKIIQELTLRSAKSFGSFHLLQMLFDEYIFFLIESHADISEEIDDTVPAEKHTRGKSLLPSVSSPSYMETFRTRYSSTSSSGRGSLTPPSGKDDTTFFSYPSTNTNYSRNINPQQRQFMFPYDEPARYESFDSTTLKAQTNFNQSLHYAPTINQSNQINQNTSQSEGDMYYSDDLEIVRQLQERTKSLMEAGRYESSTRYHPYASDYQDNRVHYQQNNQMGSYGNNESYFLQRM